ncbi:MAG: ATP synthase subunit I [Burkholderiales bacterium]|nr:ATP synthase subunit I [Burkholderiales bacterium]
MSAQAPLSTLAIRRVLRWQAIVTVAGAVVAWPWGGGHAALSAVLGGIVNIAAVVVFAVVYAVSRPATPGGTVAALFRAEASKILVIVAQLWLVLANYKDLVAVAFFATFVVTVLLFRLALLDRRT